MWRFVVPILILFNIFAIFVDARYKWEKHCKELPDGHKPLPIECKGLLELPNDLPKIIRTLILKCDSSTSKANSKNFSLKNIKHYRFLTTLTISNCPVYEIPDKIFQHNVYLASLTLENLPLKQLKNIFHPIKNLIELKLHRLDNLEHIDAFLLANQAHFTSLKLENIYLDTDNIHSLLNRVTTTVKEFRWSQSPKPLNFDFSRYPDNIFAYLRLGLFQLKSLQLHSWKFLSNINSRKILITNCSLTPSNSPSLSTQFSLENYCSSFSKRTEILQLSSIGLRNTFPMFLNNSHTINTTMYLLNSVEILIFVKKLILSSNFITYLHDHLFVLFPELSFLDLSNNRIVILQAQLSTFFFHVPYLYFQGNPFNCNCQMQWFVKLYKKQIYDRPKCQYGKKKEHISQQYLAIRPAQNFVCTAPIEITVSVNFQSNIVKLPENQKSTNKNGSMKSYILTLPDTFNYDSSIILNCQSSSNPPPFIYLTNENGDILALNKPPSPIYSKNYSLTNQISIKLNDYQHKFNDVIICVTNNTEGFRLAQIKFDQLKALKWKTNNRKLEVIRANKNNQINNDDPRKSANTISMNLYYPYYYWLMILIIQLFLMF